MSCHFCGGKLRATVGKSFVCLTCRARYEQRVSTANSRLSLHVLAEPDPEMHNLILVRDRLACAADATLDKPKEALSIIEDVWVELRSYVEERVAAPPLVEEVVDLRDRVKHLERTLASIPNGTLAFIPRETTNDESSD